MNHLINYLKVRESSYPFITGDGFLMLADYAYLNNVKPILKIRGNDQILFIDSDRIDDLNERHTESFSTLIIHNGDHHSNKIFDIKHDYQSLFLTNSYISNNNIECIPIGVENKYLRNKYISSITQIKDNSKNKSNSILVSFNCNTNTKVRCKVEAVCKKYGFINNKYKKRTYYLQLSNSRFVISPPGNGIDCHRTWESIYYGAIPVIENKYRLLFNHELPIFYINTYDEFFELSEPDLYFIYEKFMSRTYDAIWLDYWYEHIVKSNFD